MEHTFKARIYESGSPFFEGELSGIVIPTIDGEYGVLAHHRNVVTAIFPGMLHFTHPDGKIEYAITSEGIMRVENNDVLILVNSIERPEDEEANKIKRKNEEIIEAKLQKKSVEEYLEAELLIQKTMSGLRDGVKNIN